MWVHSSIHTRGFVADHARLHIHRIEDDAPISADMQNIQKQIADPLVQFRLRQMACIAIDSVLEPPSVTSLDRLSLV
jgi:hypothetical protein